MLGAGCLRPAAVQFDPSLPACHCLQPPMIRARGVSGATSLAMATRLAGADRRLACSCLAQPSPRFLSRRSRASLGTLGDWRWRCRRLRCRPRGLVGRWWCGCCLTGSSSSLQPLFLQPLTVNSPTRQPPQALKILYSTDSIKDLRRSGLPFGRWRFGAGRNPGRALVYGVLLMDLLIIGEPLRSENWTCKGVAHDGSAVRESAIVRHGGKLRVVVEKQEVVFALRCPPP